MTHSPAIESPSTVAGLLAEFAGPDELTAAADAVRQDGYVNTDAFCPFPIEGLSRILGKKKSPLPWMVFAGGVTGGVSIYGLAWWVSAVAYPLNIGGRPLHSWPSFIPPTFEGTVLVASLAAFFSVFLLSGLPRLSHSVFEVERFKRASTDAFFLWIASDDAKFDKAATKSRLEAIGAVEIWEVPSDE
ncbi:MAG TPA: DUF3341 domain-containing protein [Planctomycetaceae bacterium]|nr:DUF3341 domain-containing protein [Planctomycetaceae bacterium]